MNTMYSVLSLHRLKWGCVLICTEYGIEPVLLMIEFLVGLVGFSSSFWFFFFFGPLFAWGGGQAGNRIVRIEQLNGLDPFYQ